VPLFPHLLLPRWCQWLGLLLVMNVVIYLYYFLVPVRSVSLLGPVLTVEEANDQLRRTYPQDSRRLRYYTDK
jgi:hypothetical protein